MHSIKIKSKKIKSELVYSHYINEKLPLITVSIPTNFKRASLVLESLDSIYSQKVTPGEIEIIIVINGMNENFILDIFINLLKNLVGSRFNLFNLYIYQNAINIGMIGNWNRSIYLANAEWVSLLHDDDLLTSKFILFVRKTINSKKNIDWVSSNHGYLDINSEECKKYYLNPRLFLDNKLISKPFEIDLIPLKAIDTLFNFNNIFLAPTAGTFFKKSTVLKLGGFKQEHFPSSDWFFTFQLAIKNKVYKAKSKLGYYRIGLNESLETNTLISFIEKFDLFYSSYSNINIFFRIFNYIFFDVKKILFLKWIFSLPSKNNDEVRSLVMAPKLNHFKMFLFKLFSYIYRKFKYLFFLFF